MFRDSTCLRAAMARSVTSGPPRCDRRPLIRARPARRAGFDAALDDSRRYARRPRHRVVSAARIPEASGIRVSSLLVLDVDGVLGRMEVDRGGATPTPECLTPPNGM